MSVGTTLAVWWEFYEWIAYHGMGPPQVGYGDILLDVLTGARWNARIGVPVLTSVVVPKN